jgi:hypothetical protein
MVPGGPRLVRFVTSGMTRRSEEELVSPDVMGVLEDVQQELGSMLDVFDRDAPGYARAYVEHVMEGGPRPGRPRDMHPRVAEAVRDIVLDQAVVVRRARRAVVAG